MQHDLLAYIQNARIRPEFAKWNWTSFQYVLGLLDTQYSKEIRCIALELVEQFYEQFTQKERFPEKTVLRDTIDRAKQECGIYRITEIEQYMITD
jgi:hypothetical protein